MHVVCFFFQAEDGIRDYKVTGVQTCALPIFDADGSVKQIEIMDYRESYGHEVRNADWRAQFVHKNASAPLKLDQDIRNISGATLSSRHIADGVRRILATYDIALK